MDMNKAKISFFKISRVRADEGHGEERKDEKRRGYRHRPLTDKIIKRIEMGADLHLSHVALTSDSKYAIATAQDQRRCL